MNAKDEFIVIIESVDSRVKCAKIEIDSYDTDITLKALLKLEYTKSEYDKFLEKIDVIYNSDYGTQELFGVIWFENDTWAERNEWGGCESWNIPSLPAVFDELIR